MCYAFLSRLRRAALLGLPVMLPLPAAAARPVDVRPRPSRARRSRIGRSPVEPMLGWPGGMMGMEGSGMAIREDE